MHKKSDIFIYEIYSVNLLPVKKILHILRPILVNYKIRDKKFMWVNLKRKISKDIFWKITDLDENLFCLRYSIYKPHTLWIPANLTEANVVD